jgi:hypothetical protein
LNPDVVRERLLGVPISHRAMMDSSSPLTIPVGLAGFGGDLPA